MTMAYAVEHKLCGPALYNLKEQESPSTCQPYCLGTQTRKLRNRISDYTHVLELTSLTIE
jgi:hypothetical protein